MKLKLSDLAKLLRYIYAIYPLIVSFVKEAENAGGMGAEKMAAVRAALEKVWNYTLALGDVWDSVKPYIDGIVALYHARGIFKKG